MNPPFSTGLSFDSNHSGSLYSRSCGASSKEKAEQSKPIGMYEI